MLKNIRIVLLNTIDPSNIGATARAMKTMGLSDLYLVSPLTFPDPKAMDMASNAADVLKGAIVVDTLKAATHHCDWIATVDFLKQTIPTSLNIKTPREFAEETSQLIDKKIAIIFGNEQSALAREELADCHFCIQIPSSERVLLNLSSAVQVVAYELWVANQSDVITQEWDYRLATSKEMKHFYQHLEKILIHLQLLKSDQSTQLMSQFQRLFDRVNVDELEMKMLRGILGAIEKQR